MDVGGDGDERVRLIDRRHLVSGAIAGAAGFMIPGFERGLGIAPHPASAQSAFDFAAGAPGCSRIALMFNIGSGYEPAVGMLETLGAHGVSASMFVMGWLAEQSPWLVQEIAGWGHHVGSHGYLPPELTVRSDEDVAWDLQAASEAVGWALGYHPGPWFTPYASASDERVRSIASALGFIAVGWSVGSGDWTPGATAESIYSSVIGGVYDGAIVELHLDAQRSVDATASALPWIIEDLSAQGYRFVTIPQIVNGC